MSGSCLSLSWFLLCLFRFTLSREVSAMPWCSLHSLSMLSKLLFYFRFLPELRIYHILTCIWLWHVKWQIKLTVTNYSMDTIANWFYLICQAIILVETIHIGNASDSTKVLVRTSMSAALLSTAFFLIAQSTRAVLISRVLRNIDLQTLIVSLMDPYTVVR